MQITWNKNIEPPNKAEIEKYLNPYLWLVPEWCQRLHINLFISDEDLVLAQTTVIYHYREIQIDIFTAWLATTDEDKQRAIVHELFHGFLEVVVKYSEELIRTLCPKEENEKFHNALKKELWTSRNQ